MIILVYNVNNVLLRNKNILVCYVDVLLNVYMLKRMCMKKWYKGIFIVMSFALCYGQDEELLIRDPFYSAEDISPATITELLPNQSDDVMENVEQDQWEGAEKKE